MAVVLKTAAARAKTNAIKNLHTELHDGRLPERILLRSKAEAVDKAWNEMFVLRVEGEGYLISDVKRQASFNRIDADSIDTAVVWPLDRCKCPTGIRRTAVELAKDSAKGDFEPAEVDNLIV